MAKKNALGRGLGKGRGAIFGEDVALQPRKNPENVSRETSSDVSYQSDISSTDYLRVAESSYESGKEYLVKVSRIEPNREQPRKDFNQEQIQELANSIKRYGVLQPLLVQKKDDHYEIIAGERRWRAAKEAGIREVPVVIREYSKQQSMEIALIENVQREDLNPVEEAQAYQKLMEEFQLTQEEIAERVSKSRVAITNSLRLLKLDKRVLEMLIQNQLSSGHARALLALEDGEAQYQTAVKIINNKLSVREVEKLVKLIGKPRKAKKEKTEDNDLNVIYEELEERLRQAVGTKVTINRRDNSKGKVEIEYYSQSELERIVELLESLK